MLRRAVAAVCVAAALAVPLAADVPGAAATSVACPQTIRPIDAAAAERVWAIAATRLDALAGARTYPFGAADHDRYARTNAYAWTSGFYPTSLWLMYEHTHDPRWLAHARTYTDGVLALAHWTGTHDLGFMVGLPAATGLGIDPSSIRRAAYARAILAASRSLSSRWDGDVGAIRSANYGGRWGLIIDSAMNAPMLIEAGRSAGGSSGRRLAERGRQHLLTLARHFVRADGSTFHRMAFDPRTGQVIGPLPGQGRSADSTWARGQAWAINGFAQAALTTGDATLLATARRTADLWISRVPAGCIPAWDLDVDADTAPRDSSAAAITVDGLLILARAEDDPGRATAYRDYALATLGTLSSSPWVTDGGRGVLRRQAYSIPAARREGTYVWGDAYLLRALSAWASSSG